MRYQRQTILPEIGEEGQAKLRNARVLIVGVGGLGSPIALYLAGAGVGTIGLIDDDMVSLNNLQRQVLYTEQEIGQPKALCAARRLTSLNSEITLIPLPMRLTVDNASKIIHPYDLVVDGCDNFATRYLIDDVCREQNKPYVYGAIREFEGQVSVFHYGLDPKSYHDLFPDRENMLNTPSPPKGVLGITPSITGSVQATEVLKIICGFGNTLSGLLWTIDLRSWQSNIFSL